MLQSSAASPSPSWVDPLFWIGCCRSLEQSDLYAHPSEADSEKLLKTFNKYCAHIKIRLAIDW